MFPDLLNIGPLHIRMYGVCMAVGFLICMKIFERISSRKDLSNLVFAMLVSGIVGARTAYVIEHWSSEFAGNALAVFRVDRGGLMFYGGFILSLAVFLVWCRAKRENPLRLGDWLATVLPLGHAFGRIGCFFCGCCFGKISDSPFAVRFPRMSPAWSEQVHAGLIPYSSQHSLAVLPTQLFESLSLFVLFAFLMYVRKRRPECGFTTGVYLVSYAVVRFFIEFLRGDPRAEVGPFSISQSISLGIAFLGALAIAYSLFSKSAKGVSDGR